MEKRSDLLRVSTIPHVFHHPKQHHHPRRHPNHKWSCPLTSHSLSPYVLSMGRSSGSASDRPLRSGHVSPLLHGHPGLSHLSLLGQSPPLVLPLVSGSSVQAMLAGSWSFCPPAELRLCGPRTKPRLRKEARRPCLPALSSLFKIPPLPLTFLDRTSHTHLLGTYCMPTLHILGTGDMAVGE